jgi:enamine deaminase RidA (YjgF/YER057c/UK114 family)
MRRTVMADKGPAPAGPYSHAVVANGFCSSRVSAP